MNAALEEGDPEWFSLALRNVAEAQGGGTQLAEKATLNRERLYKILSERGNPELKSLDALLHELGFPLAVTANQSLDGPITTLGSLAHFRPYIPSRPSGCALKKTSSSNCHLG